MSRDILFERAENMRMNPTKSEKAFADLLDMNRITYKQQWVIGRYIVDFLIGKKVIEIDGSSHIGREEYDLDRDKFILSRGFNVIRINNNEVYGFDFKSLKNRKRKQRPNRSTGKLRTIKKFEGGNRVIFKSEEQALLNRRHSKVMTAYRKSYR